MGGGGGCVGSGRRLVWGDVLRGFFLFPDGGRICVGMCWGFRCPGGAGIAVVGWGGKCVGSHVPIPRRLAWRMCWQRGSHWLCGECVGRGGRLACGMCWQRDFFVRVGWRTSCGGLLLPVGVASVLRSGGGGVCWQRDFVVQVGRGIWRDCRCRLEWQVC